MGGSGKGSLFLSNVLAMLNSTLVLFLLSVIFSK